MRRQRCGCWRVRSVALGHLMQAAVPPAQTPVYLIRGAPDARHRRLLSAPLDLPPLPALLVNPGVAVATREVFAALNLAPVVRTGPAAAPAATAALLAEIAAGRNDLEAPAIELAPAIAEVLAVLRKLPGCRLARMSGSGATCFGLFESARRQRLHADVPGTLLVVRTVLGGRSPAKRSGMRDHDPDYASLHPARVG
jgi:hypothetical protein